MNKIKFNEHESFCPLQSTLIDRCNCTCLIAIEDYVMSVVNIDDTANNNVVVVVVAVVLVAVVVAWTALIPIVRRRIVQNVETAPLDINDEYDELGDEEDSCYLSNATMLMPPTS